MADDFDPECPLCQNQELTTRYYADELVWSADCLTCGVPMIVLNRHSAFPLMQERYRMENIIRIVGDQELGPGQYNVDHATHTIPDHLHWHARPISDGIVA